MVKKRKKETSGLKKSEAAPAPGEGKRGRDGHLPYLLRQAQAAVRHALDEALADLSVTVPQFSVMTMLSAYGALSAAEAARLSMLTPQTMTIIVRNLERDGLITRTPDPDHGRILRLELTAQGEKTLKKCREQTDKVDAALAKGLSKSEEKVVRTWLAELAQDGGIAL